MIELHSWPAPNGWKISIALEEMALPYETHWVNIGRGEQFAPDFLAISPNNRIPAIVDRSVSTPLSVFETGAILDATPTEMYRKFKEIAKEQGLGAAVRWREAQFADK